MAKIISELLDQIHYYYMDPKNRIIYLHSELDSEEAGVDFRMAATFVKNLDYLNSISNNDITVKMMSFGGCWNYGMAIFDAIKNSQSNVNFISSAHSRSMSSIIPQAAAYRQITKYCDFMVHYGTYADSGDFRQVINGAKFYEKANDIMLDIYANRCVNGEFAKENNMNVKKMNAFIKDKIDKLTDWWMTSEEAVYYGFMDEVI
jgi:ATP-dependent protease ClpP protease subunit